MNLVSHLHGEQTPAHSEAAPNRTVSCACAIRHSYDEHYHSANAIYSHCSNEVPASVRSASSLKPPGAHSREFRSGWPLADDHGSKISEKLHSKVHTAVSSGSFDHSCPRPRHESDWVMDLTSKSPEITDLRCVFLGGYFAVSEARWSAVSAVKNCRKLRLIAVN